MNTSTLGIIIGNRNFFPDHLVTEARNDLLEIFKNHKIKPILLNDNDTKLGGVETFQDAEKCAKLFKSHNNEIEGIIVILPNFGVERCGRYYSFIRIECACSCSSLSRRS